MTGKDLIVAALEAKTLTDAETLQQMTEDAVGARHERPLADMPNNQGLASTQGSFDHKILENVTNMQDAVLERAALAKYGDLRSVAYQTPHQASEALFGEMKKDELAKLVTVRFHESDPPANKTKRITAAFRDFGCGMTASNVPETIFGVGRWHKDDLPWLQGAFGMGAKATFHNARAVVLVTRRAPELLGPEQEDRISIAVLLRKLRNKTWTTYYLAVGPWDKPGDVAPPFSVPAEEYPDFEPGTHLALISYGVEGLYRARLGGDEKSFEAILNTRLFVPVTPVRFSSSMVKVDRPQDFGGLAKRLERKSESGRVEGRDTLPFNIGGTTYHLHIRSYVFSKPGEAGARRNFVAHDHAVVFTSNGQAHHHWTPTEFRTRVPLRKLHDRIFVVVETDELPIAVRTNLFSPDRAGLVRNDVSIRLEEAVAGFIGGWELLIKINSDLIRESLHAGSSEKSTFNIAKKISRALKIKGFSFGGTGSSSGGGGGNRGGKTPPTIDLYPDPTTLEGPAHVVAELGKTRWVNYTLNAIDDFIPRRGELAVECTHPDINGRETTIGQLRNGRIRVSIAVPDGIDTGTFELNVSLKGWVKSSGGIGADLTWTTEFEIVEERERPTRGGGSGKGGAGADQGASVALLWSSPEKQEGWDKRTVGDVQQIRAEDLAAERGEYKSLAKLGEAEIPTLILNEDYLGLKNYIGSRASKIGERALEDCRERYAVGVGVGLILLNQEEERRLKARQPSMNGVLGKSKEAVARGVLVMMPEFDALAREAGLDED